MLVMENGPAQIPLSHQSKCVLKNNRKATEMKIIQNWASIRPKITKARKSKAEWIDEISAESMSG
jgi:hypothetical protein